MWYLTIPLIVLASFLGRALICPRPWPSVQPWAFSWAVLPRLAEPSHAVRRGAYRRSSPPWPRERDPRVVHESYHRHRERRQNSHVPLVSVIVPVLDDVRSLERALEALGDDSRVEIIVVNAGERTPALIALEHARLYVRWLTSLPGRGRQMNVGARLARGDWLLFLHADTRLTAGWIEELERVGQQSSVVGGSFRFQLDSGRRWARLLECGVAARVRWLDLPYGDQALFVRRKVFAALDGYQELPLMEDVDFVRRLRRKGRLHHSTLPAVTSARRWETDGWMRRSVENVILVVLFLAGVSPSWLAARYRRGARAQARGPRVRVARDG